MTNATITNVQVFGVMSSHIMHPSVWQKEFMQVRA